MSEWTPSPELVEALRDAQAQSWGWSSWSVMYVEDQTGVINDTDAFLTAAVAFRHSDGRPELVPWEQVRELVEAAREIADGGRWWEVMTADRAKRLRAALAPFTQEPEA